MLTDRFTAQVLGGLIVVMTVLIDVSCFIFTKAEISHRPTFPLVVIVPSLPLLGAAAWLFRRAKTLKDSE